jgi:hypothetical protein
LIVGVAVRFGLFQERFVSFQRGSLPGARV